MEELIDDLKETICRLFDEKPIGDQGSNKLRLV